VDQGSAHERTRSRRAGRFWALLVTLSILCQAEAHAAAFDLSGDLRSRFESNASNSDAPADREADVFLGGQVRVGTSGVLGRDWRWKAGLVGEGEAATRFAELGWFQAGPAIALERKLGLGWQAPRLQLNGLFAARTAGQPGASGLLLAASIGLIVPITERTGLDVRYRPEWFFAESPVFASTSNEVGLSGWFDLFPKTRFTADYSFRYGDVNSYATPPRPDIVAIRVAQTTTDAFGAERVVYRVEAATHAIEGRLTQELTDQINIRAVYRYEVTEARGGLSYQNHIVEVGLHASL
jgi:hypothetical protein